MQGLTRGTAAIILLGIGLGSLASACGPRSGPAPSPTTTTSSRPPAVPTWHLQDLAALRHVQQNYTAATLGGQLHVFATGADNSSLWHAWWNGTWQSEPLDGLGAVRSGSDSSEGVNGGVTAITIGTTLHVFYYQHDAGRMRHAWLQAGTWRFEDLDGPGVLGGNGRTENRLSAHTDPGVIVIDGAPHVFYIEYDTATLRHGWFDGSAWSFENFEGPSVSPTNGRTQDPVLWWHLGVGFAGGSAQVIFGLATDEPRLRRAWRDGNGTWQFEDFDGPGAAGGNGRTGDDTVHGEISIVDVSGTAHVFYQAQPLDRDVRRLRHAWYDGTTWNFEDIDGWGAPPGTGREDYDAGTHSVALLWRGQLHVFYTQSGVKHAWLDADGWHYNIIDGPRSAYPNAAPAGGNLTGVIFQDRPQLFYPRPYDGTEGKYDRWAWYG